MSKVPVVPGAEPWSHVGALPYGVLVIHGFTGNPSSVRELAESFAAQGFHIEMPLLTGHGTSIDDMISARWTDWCSDVEMAYRTLRSRCGSVLVAGQSMGGALTLWLAKQHPEIAGIVCINPVAQARTDEEISFFKLIIDSGEETIDAIGSDIADPSVKENSYSGTPLRAGFSLYVDGVAPLAVHYPKIQIPMLLINSVNDHVVEPAQSDYLVA
ncbi:MAG: alpha/beta fold hydrolase, partial [Actinobacteria bacterium]